MSIQSTKISIAGLLYQQSPRLLVIAVLIGAIAGALYSLIIPVVLQGIDGAGSTPQATFPADNLQDPVGEKFENWFFLVVFMILVTKATSVIMVNNIAKSATAFLKLRIAYKINNAKINQIETVGFSRLLNILMDDVNNVASAAIAIPMLVVSVVTILGMLGYLATLSLSIFAITVVAIAAGVLLFQMPVTFAHRLYDESRNLKDTIQEGIKGLVMGAYELKLSREKSTDFLRSEIEEPQNKTVTKEKLGDAIIHLAGTSCDLLTFLIIGIIVFKLPQSMSVSPTKTYGIVMALLYIAGPVAHILGLMQQLQMGRVAASRIDELMKLENEQYLDGEKTADNWSTYKVSNLHYKYQDGGDSRNFALSSINLEFTRGKINFIIGGNGSGKTTLSKLLSLHYFPSDGEITFDQHPIAHTNYTQARQRIAVIYSNYYLFSRIHRKLTAIDLERIQYYLERLGLSDKTAFDGDRFTTTRLSDGQRRRLALLIALIEDKDIYVFDEWAADQDPEFKQIFYTEILPEMKQNNKLIIAITHDDRYFDFCDRMIIMEEGRIVDIKDNINPFSCSVKDPVIGGAQYS